MLVREFANLQHVSRLICPIGRLRASGRSVTISLELSWTIPVRIFEVLHAIFECHAIYFYLVQNFNNIPGLDIISWYEPIIMFTLFISLLIFCPVVSQECHSKWLTSNLDSLAAHVSMMLLADDFSYHSKSLCPVEKSRSNINISGSGHSYLHSSPILRVAGVCMWVALIWSADSLVLTLCLVSGRKKIIPVIIVCCLLVSEVPVTLVPSDWICRGSFR